MAETVACPYCKQPFDFKKSQVVAAYMPLEIDRPSLGKDIPRKVIDMRFGGLFKPMVCFECPECGFYSFISIEKAQEYGIPLNLDTLEPEGAPNGKE